MNKFANDKIDDKKALWINEFLNSVSSKFPSIDLSKALENLSNIEIINSNNAEFYMQYNYKSNQIIVNESKNSDYYDEKHLFFHELMHVLSSTKQQTGIANNGLVPLNEGITEMLTLMIFPHQSNVVNYLDETAIATIITSIIGMNKVIDCYVNNNTMEFLSQVLYQIPDGECLTSILKTMNENTEEKRIKNNNSKLGNIIDQISLEYVSNPYVSRDRINAYKGIVASYRDVLLNNDESKDMYQSMNNTISLIDKCIDQRGVSL